MCQQYWPPLGCKMMIGDFSIACNVEKKYIGHRLCETHSVHQTAGRKQASNSTALQRVGPKWIAHRLDLARHFHGNHPVQTPNTHPSTLQVIHSSETLSCLEQIVFILQNNQRFYLKLLI